MEKKLSRQGNYVKIYSLKSKAYNKISDIIELNEKVSILDSNTLLEQIKSILLDTNKEVFKIKNAKENE